jgi:UDP-N-acetylglucosamine 2-epimerase (non-hydrolysing)
LRSFDLANPFPEEANRRLTTHISALHFAPTRLARTNLLRERVDPERVVLTGNTVVDALLRTSQRADLPPPPEPWQSLPSGACPVLVTLHRRESWGEPLAGICRALRAVADALPEVSLLYPLHPQPRVRDTVEPLLGGHPRVHLLDPLEYLSHVSAMKACSFIVTDSGGIQEEAPVLAKPTLVLRDVTERPEAIEAGTAWLVGTEEAAVRDAITTMARDRERYDSMAHGASPYGDGLASERIVGAIRRFAGLPVRDDLAAPLDAPLAPDVTEMDREAA